MEKIWVILDAMKEWNALRDEREDYAAKVGLWEAWEEEGSRRGEEKPERPTLREVYDILDFHGFKWNGRHKRIVQK